MKSELYEAGLAVRKEIAGAEYVEAALEATDDFSAPMQDFVTEYAWGAVWTRPGLDRRSRSILNIGMLAAANRPDELKGHIKGAITNGLSKEEIREMLLQVSIYLGMPAGLGAFRVAREAFTEMGI
ncbi:carboxymuconolactone decarboxylase family protein [Brevibacterium sp. VCM10]|uniref:carboxymuconolactone decarboxylase family protein n=1 Tax=Brevibacterium sp. VCM10 TaxID=1381751 RepID=UPI0004701472|nr:carboxymuconolactone decarboxylase family protein [Brevibacterium sp. VCM10]